MALAVWSVMGAVFALWLWIAVRVVREARRARREEQAVRAEAVRGLRELQRFLVDH